MILQERSYSVLLVSASEAFNQMLPGLFPVSLFSPIQTARSVSAAKRAVAEQEFDLVIINSPLPDDSGIRFAIDVTSSRNTVVLFLSNTEQYNDIYEKMLQNGIFLLKKPTSRTILSAAADWLISARERMRKTEKKSLSIEERMKEIRLVNRAKWLLVSELKMTEPDAHRYIEKQAMDRCVAKKQVAEEIINIYGF